MDEGAQPSLFAVPKDESLRKQWERNLHQKDKALDETCSVCELHFEPSCITRDFVHVINGEEVGVPRGKPELLPNAVPTLLPNAPSYLSKKAPLHRPPRKRKSAGICPVEEKRPAIDASVSDQEASCVNNDTGSVSTEIDSEMPEEDNFMKLDVPSLYWSCHRILDHRGAIYCKMRMGENCSVESERVVVFSQDGDPGVAYSAHICGHLVDVSPPVKKETEYFKRWTRTASAEVHWRSAGCPKAA